jgi:coproporphyrinogen III oxidase
MIPHAPLIERTLTNAQKKQASAWFQSMQDQLCQALETIEATYAAQHNLVPKTFEKKPWTRAHDASHPSPTSQTDDTTGGGGTMAILKGHVFEKAGVNVSTVWGTLAPEFAQHIPGAAQNREFWASGVSVVIHPRSPLMPTAHMNTRMITTEKFWFGGGADLTPFFADDQETALFHGALKDACDAHDPTFYADYKKWCDDYFYLAHRQEPRGVGGIFYDDLNRHDFEKDFAFTRDVGLAFCRVYPEIVQRKLGLPWTEEQRRHQLIRRGRYVEFNLLYDRGTAFGLKTGGNVEAILMSLPPVAEWP